MSRPWRAWWRRAGRRPRAIGRTIGWPIGLWLALLAGLVAAAWAIQAGPVAGVGAGDRAAATVGPLLPGVCGVAGLGFLAVAVVGARRRAVAAEATYDALQAGIISLLTDSYVRGDLALADYEARLSRTLHPAGPLDTARVSLHLTLQPDSTLRWLSAAGGGLLLAAGLALAWPGGLAARPGPGAPPAPAAGPAALVVPAAIKGDCPTWPPGHRRQCLKWQPGPS
jgi:hypothetical protein